MEIEQNDIYHNPEKEKARNIINKPNVKRLLGMPSQNCLDIKNFIERGIVTKNTTIVAIERNKDYCKKIKVNLTDFKNNGNIKDFEIINDNFEDFNFKSFEPFDLVNMDITASLSLEFLKAISKLPMENANLYIWFSSPRSTKPTEFFDYYNNLFNLYPKLREECNKILLEINQLGRLSNIDRIGLPLCHFFLRNFNFETKQPYSYRRRDCKKNTQGLKMHLYSFLNLNPTNKPKWTNIEPLFNSFNTETIINMIQNENYNIESIAQMIKFWKNPFSKLAAYHANVTRKIPKQKSKIIKFFDELKTELKAA